MKTYNFFYRNYIRNENTGVAVDHFFPEQSNLDAKETYTYKMLSEYLDAGIVISFGWTETIPYEVN